MIITPTLLNSHLIELIVMKKMPSSGHDPQVKDSNKVQCLYMQEFGYKQKITV